MVPCSCSTNISSAVYYFTAQDALVQGLLGSQWHQIVIKNVTSAFGGHPSVPSSCLQHNTCPSHWGSHRTPAGPGQWGRDTRTSDAHAHMLAHLILADALQLGGSLLLLQKLRTREVKETGPKCQALVELGFLKKIL